MINTLRIAIARDDINLCRQLVEQGVKTSEFHKGCESCTPVCVAFAQDNLEMVELLLDYGFPVNGRLCENSQDPGFTPALLALKNGNDDLLDIALNHSTYPGSILEDGLIFAAVYFQNFEDENSSSDVSTSDVSTDTNDDGEDMGLDGYECLRFLLARLKKHALDIGTEGQPSSAAESSSTERGLTATSLHRPDVKDSWFLSILDFKVRILDLQWLDQQGFCEVTGIWTEDTAGIAALHLATALKDTMSTKLLLHYGATVDVASVMYHTPLHFAALNADLDLTSFLIQNGANIDARDSFLKTAAMMAIERNSLEILEMLYKYGANFSCRDIYGDDVLAYSCNSTAPVLAFVLSKGYHPTLNHQGLSPLGPALRSKHQGVPALALNSTLAFDHAANVARIALATIIGESNPSLLRKLMRRASPSAIPFPTSEHSKFGWYVSALHCAAAADRPDMLDILLQYGADVEVHEAIEGTPLITACSARRFLCVKLLVSRGAAISYHKDGTVWSGVRAAERYPEIVAWLLCGRFTSQKALSNHAHLGTVDKLCVLWAGNKIFEILLLGKLGRRQEESLLEQCIRVSQFRKSIAGVL